MKEKITAFIENLITYDYILFASVFGLFFLFIIIAILFRKKTTLAVVFVLLSFFILLLGPTLGYIKMHEYLFKHSLELTSQKRLTFTQAVVVKGTLTNESNSDFKSCKIRASANKSTGNALKDFVFKFKPIKSNSVLKYNILKGEKIDFKVIIEPFTYSKDYNITLGANCKWHCLTIGTISCC